MVGQALQNFLDSKPTKPWILLLLDVKNALNSLSRDQLLKHVSLRAPALMQWVLSCYGQPSFLFFGSHCQQSSTGVQQGDPLGPLLFCLTIHSILERMPDALPFNSWYLDDGTVCVPGPEYLEPLLSFLHQEFNAVGGSLNFRKCIAWGPCLTPDSSETPSLPISLRHHE